MRQASLITLLSMVYIPERFVKLNGIYPTTFFFFFSRRYDTDENATVTPLTVLSDGRKRMIRVSEAETPDEGYLYIR